MDDVCAVSGQFGARILRETEGAKGGVEAHERIEIAQGGQAVVAQHLQHIQETNKTRDTASDPQRSAAPRRAPCPSPALRVVWLSSSFALTSASMFGKEWSSSFCIFAMRLLCSMSVLRRARRGRFSSRAISLSDRSRTSYSSFVTPRFSMWEILKPGQRTQQNTATAAHRAQEKSVSDTLPAGASAAAAVPLAGAQSHPPTAHPVAPSDCLLF